MSPSKADRLIARITALHHSLQLDKDDSGPSPLERDLMLGYLRELYDEYLNADDQLVEKVVKSAPKAPPAPIAAPAPPPAPPVQPPPPTVAIKEVYPPEDVPPTPPAPAPAPKAKPGGDPDVEALFEPEAGMGNQMMRQKVSDLTRALSINNRVLFSNRLFGSNDQLNAALKDLNLKGSMEYAKPTLRELAGQHHWAAEDKRETAREFIDLVRRRYA